jgi:hypothetical protein
MNPSLACQKQDTLRQAGIYKPLYLATSQDIHKFRAFRWHAIALFSR